MDKLNPDERFMLTHITRWGSDGYGAFVTGNDRAWVWAGHGSVKGPNKVFRTKREAVASFEAFIDHMTDKSAGRV